MNKLTRRGLFAFLGGAAASTQVQASPSQPNVAKLVLELNTKSLESQLEALRALIPPVGQIQEFIAHYATAPIMPGPAAYAHSHMNGAYATQAVAVMEPRIFDGKKYVPLNSAEGQDVMNLVAAGKTDADD